MRGRPRKSTKLKIAEGDLGKAGEGRLRAKLLTEPTPRPGTPETPEALGEHGERFWSFVCEELDRENRLALCDQFSLEMAARNYQTMRDAAAKLTLQGITITSETTDGRVVTKKNPAFEIFNRTCALLKSFLEQHGLTEASRSRLHVEPKNKVDELEMALSGGDPALMKRNLLTQ